MTTRIQKAISIGVAADTTEAGKQLRQLAAVVKNVEDPVRGLDKQLKLLNRQYATGEVSINQYAAASAKIELKAEREQEAIRRLLGEYDKLIAKRTVAAGGVVGRLAPEGSPLREEGTQFMGQFQTRQQRAMTELTRANELFRQGSISQREYAQATSLINRQNSLLHTGLSQMSGVFMTLLGPLVLTIAAFEGFRRSITLAAELEAAQAKLEIFTGSAEKAKRILSELRQLSTNSPVSFTGGQKAATTMLHYGVDPNSVVDIVGQMAAITGGNTDRMDKLALALAQVNGAARLMGQELLQMVNAGFNPLKIISEQTGLSMRELKKQMEEGAISSEAVFKAMEDATSHGGRFYGILDKVADTTYGKMIKATNEIEKAATSFGQSMSGSIGFHLDHFTEALKSASNTLEMFLGGRSGSIADFHQNYTPAGWVDHLMQAGNLSTDLARNRKEGAGTVDMANAQERYMQNPITRFIASMTGSVDPAEYERNIRLRDDMIRINEIQQTSPRDRTRAENEALRVHETEERQRKNIRGAEEYSKIRDRYEKDRKRAVDAEDKAKADYDFFNEVGRGWVTSDEDKARYEAGQQWKQRQGVEERNKSTFGKVMDRMQLDGGISSQYGEREAQRVRLLREQSADTERTILDQLIASGASYQQIENNANSIAQANAKNLRVMQETTGLLNLQMQASNIYTQGIAYRFGGKEAMERERLRQQGLSPDEVNQQMLNNLAQERLDKQIAQDELYADTIKKLDQQVAYERDLLLLTKEEAEVRRIMREQDMTKVQAEEFRKREKAIEGMKKTDKERISGGAPSATGADSREAFAAMANRQAQSVAEGIRLQREQLTEAIKQRAAQEATRDILLNSPNVGAI